MRSSNALGRIPSWKASEHGEYSSSIFGEIIKIIMGEEGAASKFNNNPRRTFVRTGYGMWKHFALLKTREEREPRITQCKQSFGPKMTLE